MRMITSSMAAGSLTKPTAGAEPETAAAFVRTRTGPGTVGLANRRRAVCAGARRRPVPRCTGRSRADQFPWRSARVTSSCWVSPSRSTVSVTFVARGLRHDDRGQVRRAVDGLAVDLGDEVAGLEPGRRRPANPASPRSPGRPESPDASSGSATRRGSRPAGSCPPRAGRRPTWRGRSGWRSRCRRCHCWRRPGCRGDRVVDADDPAQRSARAPPELPGLIGGVGLDGRDRRRPGVLGRASDGAHDALR